VVEDRVHEVTAKTYPSEEHGKAAELVKGILIVRHVEPLGYVQYLVNGVPVDPETVEYASDSD
jgi:hypothetical protein